MSMLDDVKNSLAAADAADPIPQPEPEKSILETIYDGAVEAFDTASDWVANRNTAKIITATDWNQTQEAADNMSVSGIVNTLAGDNDSILQAPAQYIQQSPLAYDYMFNDRQKLERARAIQEITSIPAETILNDSDTWKQANNIYNDIQEKKQLNDEQGLQYGIEDVYREYPTLRAIADKDPVAGALALKDMPNIRKEMDIIDTFQKYMEIGNKELELNNLYFKSHSSALDDNDRQRMKDLEEQVAADKKAYDVKFSKHPLLYALSDIVQSLPETYQSMETAAQDWAAWELAGIGAGAAAGTAVPIPGVGTAGGAVAGGAIGGIAGAFKAAGKFLTTREARQLAVQAAKGKLANTHTLSKYGAEFGAFRGMAEPEIGSRYNEYKNLKDADGNPLMSDEEAWSRAVTGGSINAALEIMPTFEAAGSLFKTAPHSKKMIDAIMARNMAKLNMGESIKTMAAERLGGIAKMTAIESGEEALQTAADDLMMNDIKESHGGKAYAGEKGKLRDLGAAMSGLEIAQDAGMAFLESLPASLGFGIAGGIAGGTMAGGRYAMRQRQLARVETAFGEQAKDTVVGTAMIEQLQQAVHDSNLVQSAPDVQRKLIKDKAAGTGFETVYVDVETALEKPTGQEDLQAVAKSAGLTEDELQTAIDTKGTIMLPLECYAQSEASPELLDSVSFAPEADSMARMKKDAEYTMGKMQENAEKLVNQQIKMMEFISEELFPGETQDMQRNRQLAQAAIIANPDNPAAGLRQLINDTLAAKMAILEPALNFLNDTSGKGTAVVPIDDEGHTIRVSENAKWYQDFYAENKRKPTKQELMDIAADMVSGNSNIEMFGNLDADQMMEAKENKLRLAELDHKLEQLNGIKGKMQHLNAPEMKLTESLSPEAYKIYRDLAGKLAKAPGTAFRAARMGAILYAMHADRVAEAMKRAAKKAGKNPDSITALDAYKRFDLQLDGQVQAEALNQVGSNVVKNEFIQKEIEKYLNAPKIAVEANRIKKTAEKKAINVAEEEFLKVYPHGEYIDTVIGTVRVGVNSVHNSFAKGHSMYQSKLDAVMSLVEGMKNAAYIGHLEDLDGKKIINHFFAYPIAYNGNENIVICRVRSLDGNSPTVYIHDVFSVEDIKKTSWSVTDSAFANAVDQGLRGPTLNKHILADFYRKINNLNILSGKSKNVNEYNQMAGEKAKTAALDKLDQAKQMDSEGKSKEEVYKATGWLKGADGKWRFEIPDNINAVNFYPLEEEEQVYLSDIYNNPLLYEAYPELKYIHVMLHKLGTGIKAVTRGDAIIVSREYLHKNKEDAKSTIIHEIQHVIQRYEGFARGGSPEHIFMQLHKSLENVNAKLRPVNPKLKRQYVDAAEKADELLLFRGDEIEFEAAYKKENELCNTIAKELNTTTDDVRELFAARSTYKAKISELLATGTGNEDVRYKMYLDLAGEQEARYVQERALSSAKNSDVPEPHDINAIVLFNGEEFSASSNFLQNSSGIKGQLATAADGQRIISLFEKADESTFLHELGHVFLKDLEELALIDEQSAKDLAEVKAWADYKKGDEKNYKGTSFAVEFKKLAKDIEAAEAAGQVEEAASLKDRWMQERFARGFEMYLQHGTAPSKGLQSVFRKFKTFLKNIYFGFINEGVRANTKVERVMARMIASDDEIEAMALDDRYRDITKAGGEKLLTESKQETYKRWQEEAKAEAKEKLMTVLMKDLQEERQRKYDAAIAEERAKMEKDINSLPLYICQRVVEETGNKNAPVDMGYYPTVEAYEQELKAYGSPKKMLEDYMNGFVEEMDQKIIQEQLSEEKLAEIMDSTPYHKKLMAFEAAAMREKENTMKRINSKAQNAMEEAETALNNLGDDVDVQLDKDNKGVKAVVKAINKLRFANRWTREELEAIETISQATSKGEMVKAIKEFAKESAEWKQNLKTVQEAFDGRMRLMEKMASKDLQKMPIANACSFGLYKANEKKAASMVDRMVRAGRWDMAMQQQEVRFSSAAMANQAKKNYEKVQILLERVKKQLQARSVKLPAAERYWHRKLAYALKLIPEEPQKPEDCPDIMDIFKGLNETLDVDFDPTDIYNLTTREGFASYQSLTIAELEDVVNLLTVLYKTGRDKFKMKSFDGMFLSDVLDEIDADVKIVSTRNPKVNRKLIEEDTGGLGYNDLLAKIPGFGQTLSLYGQKYLTAHVKPEVLLKLLGKSAHKYIYGLYERAAADEGKRTAEAIKQLQAIMSVYSHEEKREWQKQSYELVLGATRVEKVSKENILCMALNMGNETNWVRLCRGLQSKEQSEELVLRKFIEDNMTAKDWDVVQKIWDHLNTYWQDTVKVEEELNGITLTGVEPRGFEVLCNGKYIHMKGGYYPIAYNPTKTTKAEQQSIDEAAKRTMTGAQVLGTGRGFTKARSETENIARPMRLQLNVIPEHVQNVIHNISFRVAARDVYRLTHSQRFEEIVRSTLGAEALRSINEWTVDCWKILPVENDQAGSMLSRAIGFLRRNATINIMGYRMWPVIENVTNIFPMADKIGAANAASAMYDYYAHKKENDQLILKSSFMSNRINSMDRDIKSIPGIFEEDMNGIGWLKAHAYSMLVFTDLMMSAPLWCRAYKDAIIERYKDVQLENNKQLERFAAAQQAVIDIKAEMADLIAERSKLRNSLQPEYGEEDISYTPSGLKTMHETNKRLLEIDKLLKPKQKKLWEAEKEVDLLADINQMQPDDILKEAEKRAIQDADAAVRDVFGSGHTKDLAPIQKGGELQKLFTSFYSFFNTQANAILAAYYGGKYAREDLTGLQNTARWMPLAKAVLLRIFMTSALTTLMKMALTGDGSDDEHKYRKVKNVDGQEIKEEIPLLERYMVQLAKNTVGTASGALVGVREIATLASSMMFDGTDYGRGFNFGSMPQYFLEKVQKTAKMASQKADRDAKIAADEERRKARYDKMTPAAKKKFDEELQYKHPVKRITYADIAKGVTGAATSLTAAKTGITDTMANTVMTTMQYIADGDGRYDASIKNMVWSAFWNKNPVEREIPQKPPTPPKRKKVKE